MSQQPAWYLELFRMWWLNGVCAAVVCGWAVRAWAEEPPEDPWPLTIIGAGIVVVSLLQFRSWRRDRAARTAEKAWTRPWLD